MNVKLAILLPLIILTSACGVSATEYHREIAKEKAFAATGAWEAAKQRGIYYRAYGNGPFWMLEINEKENKILFKHPGTPDKTFPYIQPKVDLEKGKTIYQVSNNQAIVIENNSCSDATVGAQFKTTVYVSLDIREVKGCGRALY